MKTKLTLTLFGSLFILWGALPAPGQIHRGLIRGRMTDPHGAVITGVTVKATRRGTAESRTTASNASGEYVLPMLPPGAYRLYFEKAGFQTYYLHLTLSVNQERRLDISMDVAGLQESPIEVVHSDLTRKDSATIGYVIENRQIAGLPLDGRNFLELSLLVPGAVPAAPGSAGSVRGDFAFSVNGTREDSNNFMLDGVYNVDPKLNTTAVRPPVDAVQEFEIITNSYDASFGRNGGSQVSAITRSGTNNFHGTAYEFFRNAALDARNYFVPADQPDPKYQRNQFGFSLGGPIVKDRTFFFADYEGRRDREGRTLTTNVPTLAERNGDFSQSLLPAPIDPFTQQPFPNAQIPVQFLPSQIGVRIAALYPLPNRAVPGQNYVSSPTQRDDNHHFDLRLNHALTGRTSLTARYSFADRDLSEPFTGASYAQVPGYGDRVARRGQNAMLSATRILSPALINESRFAFNRVATAINHETQGSTINRRLGLPDVVNNQRDLGMTFVSVIGFSPLGDEFNNPQDGVTNTYQLLDTATYTRGTHLLKFGFEFRANQQNAFRDVQARGALNFTGAFTRNPLADLLLGLITFSSSARIDNYQHLRTRSYNAFANDSWRVTPRLTLNAGLRYEYNTPAVDADDRVALFDPATNSLGLVGQGGLPRSGYNPDRNNLAPRVGLAWTLDRAANTVLRASYGIFYDQSALAPGEALYFNPPFYELNFNFPTAQSILTLQNPFPNTFSALLPRSVLAIQRDLQTAYFQHWNLGVQRQLGRSRLVEIAYVGSKGAKLPAGRDINQPRPSTQMPNLRPRPQFSDITLLESRANSNYHSLQLTYQQRLSGGLSVLGSYTYSKSIDDASGFFSSAGDPNFPQDSNNPGAERGRSNFDLRHRVSASYSYDLPFGKDRRWLSKGGVLAAVLGNWESFGIVTLQSGRPFTVALQSTLDNSNTGFSNLGFNSNDRPNLVGNPKLSNPTPDRWFKTEAFTVPAFGSFGNAGRNILNGPGYANVNFSLLKNIPLTERTKLQFRAETFNLFNRPNFDLPDNFLVPANLGPSNLGRIRSAQSPRHIQFGLKLLF
ncbi:MAG TPA: TonB-dependent receptor [Blastocatellia bacterium]|nr:TonB-dependent receptor [Blastocatellia bacterium]